MSDDAESRARARVGSVLDDKWSLERLLGIGGMAAVYAARHRNGARAALKVLHSDLSSNDEIRERFQREGYAANCVDHPGAVKVLDDDVITGGADAGVAYLVMELLEGQSLQDRLERGPPVGEREFLAIAESVLDVLEVAHTRGVVHRDLKPENLFLVGVAMSPSVDVGSCAVDARVKVLDFGLARLLHGQAITSHGLALGTPSFMSPEQASGKIDEIDGRTDLFALAATGFRLRTGRRIHDGANPVELVTKMANWAAPRIRTVATDVSAPFARVIDRGLEFRREDRYESAAAMRKDVVLALRELDSAPVVAGLARPPQSRGTTSVAEPTIEVSAADLESPASPRAVSNGSPRRRWVAWVVGVVLLGVLVMLGRLASEAWLGPRMAPAQSVDSARGLPSGTPNEVVFTAPEEAADVDVSPVPADAAAVTPDSSPHSDSAPARLPAARSVPVPTAVPAPSWRRNASPKGLPGRPSKPSPSRPAPHAPALIKGARPQR